MKMKIETSCVVAKKMSTSRDKAGDDEIVTCQISVKGIRVSRDQAEELAGWPIGALAAMYATDQRPWVHCSFLLPKRGLLVTGSIEHRKDSGAMVARLTFTKPAMAANIRFNLDGPDDKGATAMMSFTLVWKAAGDEVEDVESLLKRTCYMCLTFKEQPTNGDLYSDSKPNAAEEAAAGRRNNLDNKSRAAGEKQTDEEEEDEQEHEDAAMLQKARDHVLTGGAINISGIQRSLKIGYNRAARLMESLQAEGIISALKPDGTRSLGDAVMSAQATAGGTVVSIKAGKRRGSSLAELEKEAKEHAKRNPRRDPPKGGKR